MELLGNNLGERLYFLRRKNNWSQKYVAEQVDMTPMNYSRYERGQAKVPNMQKVYALAKLYDVSVKDLLKERGKFKSLPEPILDMIRDPASMPYLLEALKKYKTMKKVVEEY